MRKYKFSHDDSTIQDLLLECVDVTRATAPAIMSKDWKAKLERFLKSDRFVDALEKWEEYSNG